MTDEPEFEAEELKEEEAEEGDVETHRLVKQDDSESQEDDRDFLKWD